MRLFFSIALAVCCLPFALYAGLSLLVDTDSRENRHQRLANVFSWFYHTGFELEEEKLTQMANSSYDMLVIEPIFTEAENLEYPIREALVQLKSERPDRIVLAYIDIGEAEEWRYYWQKGWKIGSPNWIVADDPDGWEGNYPVAYWHGDWKKIWLADDGQLSRLIEVGFDGVYLDWIEAYSDDNVINAAVRDGVNPRDEMIEFVKEIGAVSRKMNPDFLIVSQNAAELTSSDSYSLAIDGLSQEQVWYDGGVDSEPKGDCPLPATDDDIETKTYIGSLSRQCRKQHDEYPNSTLHVSSAEYIRHLQVALTQELVVFTVDYAVKEPNINRARNLSRKYGFIPFVGERALDVFVPTE